MLQNYRTVSMGNYTAYEEPHSGWFGCLETCPTNSTSSSAMGENQTNSCEGVLSKINCAVKSVIQHVVNTFSRTDK